MSSVVRLNVPPFEHTNPTSLEALRRPLGAPQGERCAARCEPCPACVAAQQKAVEDARSLSADLGLRLSQLVEDALGSHVGRIEAEQAQLVSLILTNVLPHLSDAALRNTLAAEIARATDGLRQSKLHLRKNPALDLGPLPDDTPLELTDDPALPLHAVALDEGHGTTVIDPDAIIAACLDRLTSASTELSS